MRYLISKDAPPGGRGGLRVVALGSNVVKGVTTEPLYHKWLEKKQ